jgi:hypothetical protein
MPAPGRRPSNDDAGMMLRRHPGIAHPTAMIVDHPQIMRMVVVRG